MDAFTAARHLATVAALALGLTVAGCGSPERAADTQPVVDGQAAAEPTKWAGTFCAGLGEVIRSADAMGQMPSDSQARKDALLAFADSLQGSLDATAARLERLGAPEVSGGARTQQIVLDFFDAASEATATQRERLVALDPQAADFEQRLAAIVKAGAASELNGRMADVTSKPELGPAFQQAPECQQMATQAR